ncbi:MAG: aldehyde dehydrogenase family protein [Candidatus Andersenbacteria bacterium]
MKKTKKIIVKKNPVPYTPLDFAAIERLARSFADIIESRFGKLAPILSSYESYEVIKDETARTLDLLRNLKENGNFFQLRVGTIASFLPRNQPLYALTCFVLVPSLMASKVYFRIPHTMRHFFDDMLALLDVPKFFPNVIVSKSSRVEFLEERSALLINSQTDEKSPVTDVVIFTGTPTHADQLRAVFDKHTLFIANGAGHNPLVVARDADLLKAVEAVVTLQFYNQGQDCAAPNAILVHKSVMRKFLSILRSHVASLDVGSYSSKQSRVGPIGDPKDLVRIQNFLVENRKWLDLSTPGIIRASDAVVEPTIVCKPLLKGGNYNEIFAPIVFVQEYGRDSDLDHYFEDSRYAQHAMYVTLYGTSIYVQKMIGKKIKGRVLHPRSSLLHNTHLHAPGVERGTKPYGGSGYGASSISINGKTKAEPTLPQRDIFEWIVKPFLAHRKRHQGSVPPRVSGKIRVKDVSRLLKIRSQKSIGTQVARPDDVAYLDLHSISNTDNARYLEVRKNKLYFVLDRPNVELFPLLQPDDIQHLRLLRNMIHRRSSLSADRFRSLLYQIPKLPNATKTQNSARQARFFKNVYQLLLGRESGPPLAPFLMDIEGERVYRLLDVSQHGQKNKN